MVITLASQAKDVGSIPITRSNYRLWLVTLMVLQRILTGLMIFLSWHSAVAADFSGYFLLTTDYVFRGVTQSDGDPAVQLGVDTSFASGLYLGAWGSTIDIYNGPGRQRETEVIYYSGYSYNASMRWSFGTNLIAYTYPGTKGEIDYDYREVTLYGNYMDRAWLEYSYSPDIYNTGKSTRNVEMLSEWPLPKSLSLSIGVGHYDVSSLSGDSYYYWQFGITRPFGLIEVDLRFHDTSDWVRIISTEERARSRLVLSTRFQF